MCIKQAEVLRGGSLQCIRTAMAISWDKSAAGRRAWVLSEHGHW